MSIAAIVLAAGRGSRFVAGPKMLALHDGRALVRYAAEAAIGGGAGPVLVVVGEREAELRGALDGLPITIVANPDFADGLSTSLKAGFAALPKDAEGAVVLLGDMPAVTGLLVRRLVAAWREAGLPDALVPTYRGRRGNPVVLSCRLADEVALITGDVGAGPLLKEREGVVVWAVEDPAVTLDVDTGEALAALTGQARTTPPKTAE